MSTFCVPDFVLSPKATDTNKADEAPVLLTPTLTSVDRTQISTENRTIFVGGCPGEMVMKVNWGSQVVGLGFECVTFILKMFPSPVF